MIMMSMMVMLMMMMMMTTEFTDGTTEEKVVADHFVDRPEGCTYTKHARKRKRGKTEISLGQY